jgi:hypothetical protein
MGQTNVEEPAINELIVTGPLKERLFDLFNRVYAGRSDVRVVIDRRQAARGGAEPAAPERRQADRRSRPPTWIFPPPD